MHATGQTMIPILESGDRLTISRSNGMKWGAGGRMQGLKRLLNWWC